ncbi:MAG: ATP-binding cassette domain-containing protein [Fusobacteriaceae bacterium]|nr:ATP-binding cassette domain-containing protein [Fusobacteriaceae bacterium]
MDNKKKPIIQVTNLTKKFKEFVAVDDISFEVKRGEIFAFLGPNGAGKSTTIKMLTTLIRQNSGKILVNGFDTQKNQDDVRKSFGIVFQDPSLDTELTAYENMDFHATLYKVSKNDKKKKILELLEFIGLDDRKDDLVKTFSGGMKRRLEIARGLIHEPRILFLDEPTLGLDTQTRHFLWKHLNDIKKSNDMTVFMTTHYLEEAEQIADKIAIIDRGKIIAYGSVKEIISETKTKTLEDAYLKLTGENIRKDSASSSDMMRQVVRNR